MGDNTVFVLLAGGKSKRMGVAKGILKYNRTFWILEQLNRVSKTTISSVYIALGYNYQHYFDAIDWFEKATKKQYNFLGLNVKVVINKTPELGSFSTLQTVLNSIELKQDLLICPIDIPILNGIELQKIINTTNTIIIPNYKEKNGHPIKLNSKFCQRLLSIKNSSDEARLDIQIKKLDANNITVFEVKDSSVLKNLNTPKDWKSFTNKL